MQHFWTCQRQTGGVKCGHRNPAIKRNCGLCGKPRPARRKPAHLSALTLDYEGFIQLNGGEHCGICGSEPKPHRRLDRDHDHATGEPRGLLCYPCNKRLDTRATVEWLKAAIVYLERER